MKLTFLFLLILAVALAGTSCKQKEQVTEETGKAEQTRPVDPDNPTDDPIQTTDAEITAAVKAKLMQDENVAARRIDIDTENGVVTLRGVVATPTEASRAIELAQTADGVRLVHSYLKTDEAETTQESDPSSKLGDDAQDVINNAGNAVETGIEEAQDLGSDAAITAQIKWKLAKDKLVQAADIDVDTKDRRVVLSGTVASKQEAQRALQIAQSIDDVVGVESNIRVQ